MKRDRLLGLHDSRTFRASPAWDAPILLTPRFSGVTLVFRQNGTVSRVSRSAGKLLKQLEPVDHAHTPLKRGVNEREPGFNQAALHCLPQKSNRVSVARSGTQGIQGRGNRNCNILTWTPT